MASRRWGSIRSRRNLPAQLCLERMAVHAWAPVAVPPFAVSRARDHPPASSGQRRARLSVQNVGDESQISHRARSSPRCGVEHRARILCAISRQTGHFSGEAILQSARHGATDDGDSTNGRAFGASHGKYSALRRAVMPMYGGDESVRLAKCDGNDPQRHAVTPSASAGRSIQRGRTRR